MIKIKTSGTIWRSAGDGEKRKYDCNYDAANRLMLAHFGQYNSSNKFSNDKVNYNAKMGDGANSNTAYDANGNIKLMYHYGLKINSSEIIDKYNTPYFLDRISCRLRDNFEHDKNDDCHF